MLTALRESVVGQSTLAGYGHSADTVAHVSTAWARGMNGSDLLWAAINMHTLSNDTKMRVEVHKQLA
jgi:diacylglycerol kinase family enzyme